jgi:hypothetical protein
MNIRPKPPKRPRLSIPYNYTEYIKPCAYENDKTECVCAAPPNFQLVGQAHQMWRVQRVHISKELHTAHGLLVVCNRSPTKRLHTTQDMDQAAILCVIRISI